MGKTTDAADFKKAKITLCRYIGSKTFEGSDKASYALEYGIAPVSVKPEAPQIPSRRKVIVNSDGTTDTVVLDDDAFDHEKEVYKRDWFQYERDVKKYDKEAEQWATNSAKMYHIVMQHCSSEMEERLQALQEWPRIKADQDVLKLIRSIESISHQHNETKQGTMALVESDIRMITLSRRTGRRTGDTKRGSPPRPGRSTPMAGGPGTTPRSTCST